MAAVEHADYRAWRYLLTQHCGVKLGKYGDELFEATIVVKFSLDVDVKGHVHENGKIDYDSVRFCGTHQRKHSSKEYLKALDRIAALDDNANLGEPGVEIKIPVKLDLYTKSESIPTSLGEIVDIVGAEKEAQEQWKTYYPEDLESGAIRCTFVTESTSVDLQGICWTPEVREGTDNKFTARKSLGQLLRWLFDSTHRNRRVSYAFGVKGSDQDPGLLELICEEMMPAIDFEAMCSAVEHTQDVTKLSLELGIYARDLTNRDHWWMWLAYDFFSKRARMRSSVEGLLLLSLGRLNTSDMRAFTSVLTTEYPEELDIPWYDVAELAKALCDPNNPLTKCARRLRVCLLRRMVPAVIFLAGTAPNFEYYVDASVKMLEDWDISG